MVQFYGKVEDLHTNRCGCHCHDKQNVKQIFCVQKIAEKKAMILIRRKLYLGMDRFLDFFFHFSKMKFHLEEEDISSERGSYSGDRRKMKAKNSS